MPTFTYKARDSKGMLKQDSIVADNPNVARNLLKQNGLWVVAIEESLESKESNATTKQNEGPSSFDDFLEKYQPITLKDMVIFSRQFASMIEAGVAMLRALNVLTEQTTNKRLKKALIEIKYDIEQGGTLSSALEKHDTVFDRLYISMVKAGEAGGVLDQVLNRLAIFIEERNKLTQQFKSAMTYPAVVTFIAVGVFYAMLTLVLPTFTGLFNSLGSDLPAYTVMLIKISEFLRSWYFAGFIVLIIAIVVLIRRWYRTEEGKYTIDAFLLKVPVFGDIINKVAVARFTRTFGTLTKTGVPIVTALEVVKDTSGNNVLSREVSEIITKVQEGGAISEPIKNSKIFPPMVTQMVTIGEETGQLEHMLEKVADFYDTEVESAVEALTSLMEPLMIVVLGGLVGAIVIGMYLPIFTIISKIQ